MGLSVSQVRLLALTTRKADVELQMQIDSKRKQMLTRQSTELSEQYYRRLQDSNIMYATSNGYEDVTYGYLMGDSQNGHITNDFYNQLLTGADNNIPMKAERNMILINKFGEVVVDNDVAKAIANAKIEKQGGTILEQTAEGIRQLVLTRQGSSQSQLSAIDNALNQLDNSDPTNPNLAAQVIQAMIKNGGYQSGDDLYVSDKSLAKTGPYYKTSKAAEDAARGVTVPSSEMVTPQDGYCYHVLDYDHQDAESGVVFMGGKPVDLTLKNAKYLGALVSYFSPIISAGLQNGISCAYDTTIGAEVRSESSGQRFDSTKYDDASFTTLGGTTYALTAGNNHNEISKVNATTGASYEDWSGGKFDPNDQQYSKDFVSYAIDYLSNQPSNTMVKVTIITGRDSSGADIKTTRYFMKDPDGTNADGTRKRTVNVKEITESDYNTRQSVTLGTNIAYENARDVSKLQAGFKSGEFQLAMVDDVSRGSYKHNTLLNYFTQLNYVVEKTDSSKREELTAWFNAEQAAISEKETYWDAEIQNLSTELSSITTEIDSVKQLKSNAIKSVFDWGGS